MKCGVFNPCCCYSGPVHGIIYNLRSLPLTCAVGVGFRSIALVFTTLSNSVRVKKWFQVSIHEKTIHLPRGVKAKVKVTKSPKTGCLQVCQLVPTAAHPTQ